jgi:ATP-dependent Clp protease ATP-binding subunit ClpC
MFDRMTDHARAIMGLARRNSKRLNHDSIRTEHILLGLIEEHEGVADAVISRLGLKLESIREALEKQTPPRSEKPVDGLELHYSAGTKHAMESALHEAESMSHNYIGSEHLLLALIKDEEGIAGGVLREAGLTVEAARQEIEGLLIVKGTS